MVAHIKKHVLTDAPGLIMNWLLSVFQVVCCRWQTLSGSWARSKKLSTNRRPRGFNWAGPHSCGRHATRGSSPSTKASKHSTFVSSTACWSREAWTGSYACGTPSFQGEKKEFDGIYAICNTKKTKCLLSSNFPVQKANGHAEGPFCSNCLPQHLLRGQSDLLRLHRRHCESDSWLLTGVDGWMDGWWMSVA